MYVRFWDKVSDTVLTRYIHSEFLGSAKANDLVACFENLNKIQPLTYMLQVSMDGPNVNLSAYEKIEEYSKRSYGHGLLNIGTCGLHQAHNALKCVMSPNDNEDCFKIQQFLNALYRLFNETPARREQYTNETESDIFPQSFAKHRWADNGKATKRAVVMLPHLKRYCRAISSKKKGLSKPTCKSYEVVKEFVQDKFALVKLEFFIAMCEEIEQFLIIFQTDRPMAPFLIKELNGIMISVARRFLTDSYCTDLKNTPMDLELRDSAYYLSTKKIDLGFAANKVIDEMLKSDLITVEEYDATKKECRDACVRFIGQLHKRSPAQHKLALNLACLNPKLIANNPTSAVSKFKRVMKCIVDAELIDAHEVDRVIRQFRSLVDSQKNTMEFKEFKYDKKDHRVDTLFHRVLHNKHEYQYVCPVIFSVAVDFTWTGLC